MSARAAGPALAPLPTPVPGRAEPRGGGLVAARPRARRAVQVAAGIAGVAAFAWLVYRGLTWDLRPAGGAASTAFRPVPVARGDLRETVVATGTTEPRTRLVVQSEIGGIVAQVHVNDGDRVRRDQPLVELDHRRLADRVAQLRAARDRQGALARIDLVGRARAELDQARWNAPRFAKLFAQGLIAESEAATSRRALQVAQIAYVDAGAETAARKAAATEADEALEAALRDLEKAQIRSPIDGIVIRRDVQVGTAVADLQTGGTVIAVLADDSAIHLRADVDEHDVSDVREGQAADVRIDALPGETFAGTVRKISTSGTTRGGVTNFQVEIVLPPDDRIRVGMTADARVVVREHHGVLLVPNTAIVRSDAGARLRLAEPGRADAFHLVPFREGYSDGFQTIVASGPNGGDTVLVPADAASGDGR